MKTQEESADKSADKGVSLLANHDGTVTDTLTGLVWQGDDDGQARDYKAAISYCKKLRLGGKKGWKLPRLSELLALVDPQTPNRTDPAFPNGKPERYWTITEFDSVPDGKNLKRQVAYTVDFTNGQKTTCNKTEEFLVRAILRR